MKYFITLLIFLFLFSLCNAQWAHQTITDRGLLLTIDFTNSMTGFTGGWGLGIQPFAKGYYTTNAGVSWNPAGIPDTARSLVCVQFLNSQTGYISGAYNVTSGTEIFTDRNLANQKEILQIFRDKLENSLPRRINIRCEKYLLGMDALDNYRGLFLKTTNGGQNWCTYGNIPSNIYYLSYMHFFNLDTGYVIGCKSSIGPPYSLLKTTDGGLNWEGCLISGSMLSLNSICFLNVSTGFVVGEDTSGAVILKTADNGNNWQIINLSGLGSVFDIDFIDNQTGFVLAAGYPQYKSIPNRIYKTTNSGNNWFQITNFSNHGDLLLLGVDFVSTTGKGICYGNSTDSFYVFGTSNYGETWLTYKIYSESILAGSKLIDANNWFVCGGLPYSDGLILHSTNGGGVFVKKISEIVPGNIELFQNYPNPFNALTIIGFQYSEFRTKVSNVTLKIYDVLGKELSTLVNGKYQPGTYQVSFDGSRLPSGVYFYRLQMGDYSEIRKMTLIK